MTNTLNPWLAPFNFSTFGVAYNAFGAAYMNNMIVLPAQLVAILATYSVYNLQEFLHLLEIAPESFAEDLNWSRAEVERAKNNLITILSQNQSPSV